MIRCLLHARLILDYALEFFLRSMIPNMHPSPRETIMDRPSPRLCCATPSIPTFIDLVDACTPLLLLHPLHHPTHYKRRPVPSGFFGRHNQISHLNYFVGRWALQATNKSDMYKFDVIHPIPAHNYVLFGGKMDRC
jgi:hypothetical protein